MKKIAMLMSATLMVSSLMVPVSAKTKSLYVLSKFTCEGQDVMNAHVINLSYKKTGLLSKVTNHTMNKLGKKGYEKDREVSNYTYKGTKLVKHVTSTEMGSTTTTYKYAGNKASLKIDSAGGCAKEILYVKGWSYCSGS